MDGASSGVGSPPHSSTVRAWAEDGRIYATPIKAGRDVLGSVHIY
ncbi:excisionase [Ralstonia edaphi]